MLRDEIELVSPESFVLQLEVGGLGSRFLAILTDTTIQSLLIVLIFAGGAGTIHMTLETFKEHALSWVGAVVFVLLFLVTWGYFVFFETVWDGQSPGKRMFGLRVSKMNGQPLTVFDSVVRNLVRYLDFFPSCYGMGVTVALCNKYYRRIGDYAAGTVVLRVRSPELTLGGAAGLPSDASAVSNIGSSGPQAIQSIPSDTASFTRQELMGIILQDYEIVRNFLLRRDELELAPRQHLSDKIASGLKEKMAIPSTDPRWRNAEEFLQALSRLAAVSNLRR